VLNSTVLKTSSFVLALALVTSSASALPLLPPGAIERLDAIVNVNIVCEENGYCYQRGRRPVARWVYGDDAFHGPGAYAGPGSYGRPGRHWAWWAFLGF